MVVVVEDDGLIEKVLRHEEVGCLGGALGLPMGIELEGEVHLVG